MVCEGCGLELPATGLPPDPSRNASSECWQLYGEVQGYALRHLELVRDLHQRMGRPDPFGPCCPHRRPPAR